MDITPEILEKVIMLCYYLFNIVLKKFPKNI